MQSSAAAFSNRLRAQNSPARVANLLVSSSQLQDCRLYLQKVLEMLAKSAFHVTGCIELFKHDRHLFNLFPVLDKSHH